MFSEFRNLYLLMYFCRKRKLASEVVNHHQQYADDYRTQVVEPELIQYNEQQESKSSDYYSGWNERK